MRSKLINIGDTVFLNEKVLKRYNIPFELRECVIKKINGDYLCLFNERWELYDQELHGSFMNDIFITSNINYEFYKLLDAGIEFIEIIGKTVDGKEIVVKR